MIIVIVSNLIRLTNKNTDNSWKIISIMITNSSLKNEILKIKNIFFKKILKKKLSRCH